MQQKCSCSILKFLFQLDVHIHSFQLAEFLWQVPYIETQTHRQSLATYSAIQNIKASSLQKKENQNHLCPTPIHFTKTVIRWKYSLKGTNHITGPLLTFPGITTSAGNPSSWNPHSLASYDWLLAKSDAMHNLHQTHMIGGQVLISLHQVSSSFIETASTIPFCRLPNI